jgi:hypothetical protein
VVVEISTPATRRRSKWVSSAIGSTRSIRYYTLLVSITADVALGIAAGGAMATAIIIGGRWCEWATTMAVIVVVAIQAVCRWASAPRVVPGCWPVGKSVLTERLTGVAALGATTRSSRT